MYLTRTQMPRSSLTIQNAGYREFTVRRKLRFMEVPQDYRSTDPYSVWKRQGRSLSTTTFPAVNPNSQADSEEEWVFARLGWSSREPVEEPAQNRGDGNIERQGLKYDIFQAPICSLQQDLSTDPSHSYYFGRVLNVRLQHMASYPRRIAPLITRLPVISASGSPWKRTRI